MKDKTKLKKNTYSIKLLTVFSAILCSVILYAFYKSDLHIKLENTLFDLRTKTKTQLIDNTNIAVVLINDNDIKELEGGDKSKLSISNLTKITKASLEAGAEKVGVLLPHQDFKYTKKDLLPILDLKQHYPNLIIGIYDKNTIKASRSRLSPTLKKYNLDLLGADTHRNYRREVIRELELFNYRGKVKMPHFITSMSFENPLNQESIKNISKIKLNYFLPHTFLTVKSTDLLHKDNNINLKNKTVIVGYSSFRKRKGIYADGTYVNTPWQNESNDISRSSGMPLVYVYATAISNLKKNSWLKDASKLFNIGQTIIIIILSLFIWKLAPAISVLTIAFTYFMLVIIHGFIFTYAHSFIPLADTTIFGMIATILGAFIKALRDNAKHIRRELKAQSKQELAHLQAGFLHNFTDGLLQLNSKTSDLLEKIDINKENSKDLSEIYTNAIQSSFELDDYLTGIKQFAEIDNRNLRKVKRIPIRVDKLIAKILNQFTRKTEEKNITIIIRGDSKSKVWSDPLYLEPILFNLISNAIKYSPDNEKIEINITTKKRKEVSIAVTDHGPGIKPEYLDRIFEKFYRVKDDNVYKIKGNGLGLYLSQFFAHKIHTHITVESTVNEGATFTIQLERYQE